MNAGGILRFRVVGLKDEVLRFRVGYYKNSFKTVNPKPSHPYPLQRTT